MNIIVYFQSHPNLNIDNTQSKTLNFLKERLYYILNDYKLEFTKAQSTDDLYTLLHNCESKELVISTTLLNPLLDGELLRQMIDLAKQGPWIIKAKGEVPGTAPLFVCDTTKITQVESTPVRFCYSQTQRKYNTQVNLGRLKRVKLFHSFLKHFPNLHKTQVTQLLDFCGTKEGTAFILAYGEDVSMSSMTACPLCNTCERRTLYTDVGHPVMGFLTRHSEYYFQCRNCELVYQDPQMEEKDLWRYYDSYAYEFTPSLEELKRHFSELGHANTSHYLNYQAVLPYFKALTSNANVGDLGGGTGEFTVFLRQHFSDYSITLWDHRISIDLQQALNQQRVVALQANFFDSNLGNNEFDALTSWEVIEHIPVNRLTAFFSRVNQALRHGGLFVLSTPDFDSPYCQALDFWAMAPGEHLSVLSRRVLEPLLKKTGFEIIGEHHECVTLKSADRWFKYGLEAHAFPSAQGESTIINDFLRNDDIRELHLDYLRQKNLGSEIILCCRKIKTQHME
jgi:2-polyprenyl-3-methyl-5-hydroxy-6-metoxy-1,4-benzoquinol methylase